MIAVDEKIGELLANGYPDSEIVILLLDEFTITEEEAVGALRGVYDQWSNVTQKLNLQIDDLKNWHIHQRTNLLKNALLDKQDIKAQRIALSILDSLAELQGLTDRKIDIGAGGSVKIELISKVEDK